MTVAVFQRQCSGSGAVLFAPQFTDGTVDPVVPVAFSGTVADGAGVVGAAFTLALASHFAGTETPFSYAVHAGALPAGLTLDADTGTISGNPTVEGDASGLVVRATDGDGNTADTNAFTLAIAAAPTSLVTLAEVKQYLDMALSMSLPDFAVQAAIDETLPYLPALAAAGYTAANQKMVQCIAAVIVAAAGSPRTLTSQHAPSGAARSFKAYDDALTQLRRSLRAKDPAGVMAPCVGPDPKANTLFMVVC